MTILSTSVTLPCGVILPNRLAKAAMTEGLADPHNRATARIERLYRIWSEGGAGLLLTGNVQIDRAHLEGPGNVAIAGAQDAEALGRLTRWAHAATSAGNQCFMQISHAGRQTQRAINPTPKAPSSVGVALPGNRFGTPVPLTGAEIEELIERFATAAAIAQDCGFTGVQLHAAHGYLLSSFLSPRTNTRTDEWGGSLEGRARFLREALRRTRARVGDAYPISVKLNSADFQRGGFSFEDSLQVAGWLDEDGVDLLEISGGSYEQPSMMRLAGLEPVYDPETAAASTTAREAYFQRFAPAIRAKLTRARLMVTGGFRSVSGMQTAIEQDGIDAIGLGRPLCVMPDAPARLLDGRLRTLDQWENRLAIGPGLLGKSSPIGIVKVLNGFGAQSWFYEQLHALADDGVPKPKMGVLRAFVSDQRRQSKSVRALQKGSGSF